jgi:hypothetical protein
MISISKYNHKKAVEYFERSKYKKLKKIIGYADTDKMSLKEIIQLISFKALVEQKLHGIYWSDEVAQLELEALDKAGESSYLYVLAKLSINKAQIIIRNKKDDNRFESALELLSLADKCFAQLEGCELDKLFVKDEKLRTEFEFLRNSGRAEEINRIVEEYIILDSRFDKFRGEKAETWQLNAEFHSLKIMAYTGYPYAKDLGMVVAEKFFSRGNKLKALAAIMYTLGRVGFYIYEALAWIRGE